MALGAISIAEHVHRAAARYPIYVALHTDHCQADKLDAFVMPLVKGNRATVVKDEHRHRHAVRLHRAIADHCFRNYDGVLRVDGEVGNKKAYDPRSYMTLAEKAMAARVVRATTELRSAGTTMMQ
jgi:fructose/tagatose bisphosphate aldolase